RKGYKIASARAVNAGQQRTLAECRRRPDQSFAPAPFPERAPAGWPPLENTRAAGAASVLVAATSETSRKRCQQMMRLRIAFVRLAWRSHNPMSTPAATR